MTHQISGQRYLQILSATLLIAGITLGVLAWVNGPEAKIVINWETASEVDAAGFNIYRSDNPDGPFTRLNRQLIPASGDPLVGGAYSYVDQSVDAGRSYYYRLEDVDLTGSSTSQGVIQVKAQRGDLVEVALAATFFVFGGAGIFAARRFFN
ncbi:MAG TPA: hypothetical protein VE136_08315 [Anaerolineales bacterium]|jgi:hypothetical protein|nr:hypothetical protein [Anaerolineales bacterium]